MDENTKIYSPSQEQIKKSLSRAYLPTPPLSVYSDLPLVWPEPGGVRKRLIFMMESEWEETENLKYRRISFFFLVVLSSRSIS